MRIDSLSIENFRNIEQAELAAGPGMNWLYGSNGAGKTSVLEAICVLARGRSFRSGAVGGLIRDEAEALRVRAHCHDPEHRLAVERRPGDWLGRINRAPCQRLSEFARALPLVLIEPETHQLVEGPPALRRSFLDWGLFHVEQRYLDDWKRYNRLLRQRNAALRSAAMAGVLDALESAMAVAAVALDAHRRDYTGQLAATLTDVERGLEFRLPALALQYRAGADDEAGYAALWREFRGRDREAGFTREGPHRADLKLRMNQRAVAPRLSRGQMKLAAVLLKLAQLALGRGTASPVLLLDDPVSELDADHLARLLLWLESEPIQVWLTAVDAPASRPDALFHVEQGKIERMV